MLRHVTLLLTNAASLMSFGIGKNPVVVKPLVEVAATRKSRTQRKRGPMKGRFYHPGVYTTHRSWGVPFRLSPFAFAPPLYELELELELILTYMTQKPVLRPGVRARAWRASYNISEEGRQVR